MEHGSGLFIWFHDKMLEVVGGVCHNNSRRCSPKVLGEANFQILKTTAMLIWWGIA
jgi:hypothetical protein